MCHPSSIYRFHFDISGEEGEQRQKGIWQEGIEGGRPEGLGLEGWGVLWGAWEGGDRSLLPPHPSPLLHPFLPPHNRIARRQNCPSCLDQEELPASPTASKPGPPSGEGSGGHEGSARVTSHGSPSCACPLPQLCSGEGDCPPPPRGLWSLADTPAGAHRLSPLGMLTEKANLLARENSIKKKK